MIYSQLYCSSSKLISSTSCCGQPIKSKCHHSETLTLKPCFSMILINKVLFFPASESLAGVAGQASFLKLSYPVGIFSSSFDFQSTMVMSSAHPRLCLEPLYGEAT